MVKFNTKVSKYTTTGIRLNHSKYSRPAARVVDQTLAKLVNRDLFGDKHGFRAEGHYVHLPEEDGKIPLQAYPKAAKDIVEDFKRGYVLFIDDERTPGGLEAEGVGRCVVAVSSFHAQQVVEQLGCPSFIHLDWYLGSGVPTVMQFVKWFTETYEAKPEQIHPDFEFHAHSSSYEGRAETHKAMHAFMKKVKLI